MINFSNLNNKVMLKGTIINSIRQKYNKDSGEQIVYFVLAVDRTDYPLSYNKETNNYFYCYASEILMGGTFLDMIRNKFKTYDNVKILGILDNSPIRYSSSKEVNKRAKICYVSFINIIDITIDKEKSKCDEKEILLINSIRKQFGKGVDVEIEEGAMNKDMFGFDSNDIPNY